MPKSEDGRVQGCDPLHAASPRSGGDSPSATADEVTPVGMAEIATALGVKPQTVKQWAWRGLLPAHRWVVSGQRAWSWPDVEAWARATGRLDPEN